ncbi:MAG: phosphate-starvation-inducible PsiE family protein [Nitrospira sp.]
MTNSYSFPWFRQTTPSLATIPSATGLAALWDKGTQIVLSLLIVTLLVGLAGGVAKTFLGLRLLISSDIDLGLRHLIVDTLMLLAVVEVLKTTLAYFSEGRVRVTFIVDTVLVVMLTEVISQWFTGGDWQKLDILALILTTLGLVRVVAVRFSPTPAASGLAQSSAQT